MPAKCAKTSTNGAESYKMTSANASKMSRSPVKTSRKAPSRRSARLALARSRPEPTHDLAAFYKRFPMLFSYNMKSGIACPGITINRDLFQPDTRVLVWTKHITESHIRILRTFDHPSILEYIDSYLRGPFPAPHMTAPFPRQILSEHYFTDANGHLQVPGNAIATRLPELGSLREFCAAMARNLCLAVPEDFVWHVAESITTALGYIHYGFSTFEELLETDEGVINKEGHGFGWTPTAHRKVCPGSIFMTYSGNQDRVMQYPRILLGDFNDAITRRDARTLRVRGAQSRNGSFRFHADQDISEWWSRQERKDIRGLLFVLAKLTGTVVHGSSRFHHRYIQLGWWPHIRSGKVPNYSAVLGELIKDWTVVRRSDIPRFSTIRQLARFIHGHRPRNTFHPLKTAALRDLTVTNDVEDTTNGQRQDLLISDVKDAAMNQDSNICTDPDSWTGDGDSEAYLDYVERQFADREASSCSDIESEDRDDPRKRSTRLTSATRNSGKSPKPTTKSVRISPFLPRRHSESSQATTSRRQPTPRHRSAWDPCNPYYNPNSPQDWLTAHAAQKPGGTSGADDLLGNSEDFSDVLQTSEDHSGRLPGLQSRRSTHTRIDISAYTTAGPKPLPPVHGHDPNSLMASAQTSRGLRYHRSQSSSLLSPQPVDVIHNSHFSIQTPRTGALDHRSWASVSLQYRSGFWDPASGEPQPPALEDHPPPAPYMRWSDVPDSYARGGLSSTSRFSHHHMDYNDIVAIMEGAGEPVQEAGIGAEDEGDMTAHTRSIGTTHEY